MLVLFLQTFHIGEMPFLCFQVYLPKFFQPFCINYVCKFEFSLFEHSRNSLINIVYTIQLDFKILIFMFSCLLQEQA